MATLRAGLIGNAPIVDAVTGLVHRIVDLPLEPGEPRIFNCAAVVSKTGRYVGRQGYEQNGGAALERDAARHAALGECLERYAASVYDPSDIVLASVRELSSASDLVIPSEYALFGKSTVPTSPWTEETPIGWVEATRLPDRAPSLVPASLVFMPYEPVGDLEKAVAPAVSTGLCAGRTLTEALLGGMLECIERDAFVISWLNQLCLGKVQFLDSPTLREIYQSRLIAPGLEYHVVRLASDLEPIHSFICVLEDRRSAVPWFAVGGAAGLDPDRAILKAMVEAAQTRQWARFLRMQQQAYQKPPKSFEDHVLMYASEDMRSSLSFLLDASPASCQRSDPILSAAESLRMVVAALMSHNLEIFAVDLTPCDVEDAGFRVVKVLIPWLQPLYADEELPFLGGRRLYDVPAALGLLPRPRREDELNKTPHPYP